MTEIHRLTKPQAVILSNPKRFKVVNAGRRFGKSWLCGAAILDVVSQPNRKVWYVAPTWDMAKQIMWDDWLKRYVPRDWIQDVNKIDKTYIFKNGSILYVKSADNPEHLRGTGIDLVIMDECSTMNADAYTVIRPSLSDKHYQGRAIFVSTPKGLNWFYDLYQNALKKENQDQWACFQYTTLQGGNVLPEEVERARREMSEKQFRQEYEASFETIASRVYDQFDRNENVCEYNDSWRTGDIHIGIDFNVNPMTAAIAKCVGDDIVFFDEIVEPNSNTQWLCNEINRRFPRNRKCEVFVYPDPTCRKRQTNASAGQTDFDILRRNGFHVLVPHAPYPSRDKFNAFNTACCNAAMERHVFLCEGRCRNLYKALNGYTYREDGQDTDKSTGFDHITDAAAYLVAFRKPIQNGWGLNRPRVFGY